MVFGVLLTAAEIVSIDCSIGYKVNLSLNLWCKWYIINLLIFRLIRKLINLWHFNYLLKNYTGKKRQDQGLLKQNELYQSVYHVIKKSFRAWNSALLLLTLFRKTVMAFIDMHLLKCKWKIIIFVQECWILTNSDRPSWKKLTCSSYFSFWHWLSMPRNRQIIGTSDSMPVSVLQWGLQLPLRTGL